MKFSKKIVFFLLCFATVLAMTLVISGCGKKVEPDGESGIIIVTAEDFKKNIKVTGGKLSPFSVKALADKDVKYIVDDQHYYALVYVKDDSLYGMSVKLGGASWVFDNELYVLSDNHNAKDVEIHAEYSSVYQYAPSDEELYGNKYYSDSLYSAANVYVDAETKKSDYYLAIGFKGGRVVEDKVDIWVETYHGSGDETLLQITKDSVHSKYTTAQSSVKYINESDYLSGNIDGKLKDSISMTTGERYFAVIDYVLSAPFGITKTDTAKIHFDVYDAGSVDDYGKISESNNFNFDVEEFPTSQYEKSATGIDAEFTLQVPSEGEKRYRFIISVSPVSSCTVKIKSILSGENISFLNEKSTEGSMAVEGGEEIERNFEYELSADQSYYIVVGLGAETSDTVTVPSTYKGKPVKEIADNTFSHVTYLKEVRLSSGVQKIGKNAFKACTGLKFIVIPSSVTVIAQNAFDDCNLKLYFVGKTLPSTFESGWNPENLTCYYDCKNGSGSLTYTLNSDGLSYTVSGGDCGGARIVIPAIYENYPVTKIASGLKNFSGVTVHESITSIASNALNNTTSLTYAKIPMEHISKIKKDKLQTLVITTGTYVAKELFKGCKSLQSVTLADSITEIKESAFYNCTALSSIDFGGVTKIGKDAFSYCAFTALDFSDGNNSINNIGQYAFSFCPSLTRIVLGDNITTLGTQAFYGCAAVKSLSIGGGITTVPEGAFHGLRALNTLNIPQNIHTIGKGAFAACDGLVTVSFEGSTPTINTDAFAGCYALLEVLTTSGRTPSAGSSEQGGLALYAKRVAKVSEGSAIENKDGYLFITVTSTDITVAPKYYLVKYAGEGGVITLPADYKGKSYTVYQRAFYNNDNITDVTVSGKATEIGAYAFWGCGKITNVRLTGETETVLPYAFSECINLTHLTVGNYVKTVSEYAFSSCQNLVTVKLGNSVKTIGDRAFSSCESITSITFGSTLLEASVDRIGAYAFAGCYKLNGVIELPGDVTYIGEYAFRECYKITEIRLGGLVETIGIGALDNCTALERITVSEYNLDFKTEDGVLYSVKNGKTLIKYPAAKSLAHFTIPSDVDTVGERAFYATKNLKSVTVSDSVTVIEGSAFGGCYYLSVIEIGKAVTSIGVQAFSSCERLYTVINRSDITVTKGSSDNGRLGYYAKNIVSDGEIVLSGDFVFVKLDSVYTLIGYNGNSAVLTLPEGISGEKYTVGAYAFYNNDNLTSINIPSEVTEIQPYAFAGCDNVTGVVFENKNGWYVYSSETDTNKISVYVWNPGQARNHLTLTEDIDGYRAYGAYIWKYEGN